MSTAPLAAAPAPAGGGAPRSVAELEAFLRRHRTAALAGAGGLVVAFALLSRRKAKNSSDPAAIADGYSPASYGTGAPTGYANAGAAGVSGGYDSTASDIYNALQPAVEDLQSRLDVLERGQIIATAPDTTTGSPTAAAPSPTPAPTAAAPKPTTAKARAIYQAGDTIWTFSARYGITATQLLTMNNLPQSTRTIAPGTSLRVQL